jgi:ubiquitin C
VEVQTLYFERFHGYYWDYFGSLKAQIRDRWHVPSDQQRLHLAGVQLQDGHTLSDYNIQKGSIIALTVPMRLFARMMSGKTIELELDWFEDVSDVQRNIHDKEHIPEDHMRLHLAGRNLRSHWKLSDLQIQSGSTLDLVVTPPPSDF